MVDLVDARTLKIARRLGHRYYLLVPLGGDASRNLVVSKTVDDLKCRILECRVAVNLEEEGRSGSRTKGKCLGLSRPERERWRAVCSFSSIGRKWSLVAKFYIEVANARQ